MRPDDILAVVRSVLIDTFLDDDLEVSRETTALDVPGWDSLSHTIVLLAIEERLKVRVRPGIEFADIGELVDHLARQLAAASR